MRPQYALAILIHALSSLLLLAPGTSALVTIESDFPIQLVDGYAILNFDSGLNISDTPLIGGNWSKFDLVNVTVQKTPAAAPNATVDFISWTPNTTTQGGTSLHSPPPPQRGPASTSPSPDSRRMPPSTSSWTA